jgi:hypothetical protein
LLFFILFEEIFSRQIESRFWVICKISHLLLYLVGRFDLKIQLLQAVSCFKATTQYNGLKLGLVAKPILSTGTPRQSA